MTSSTYSGISICHHIYDEKALTLALRHAIYSAILNTEATATFMFLSARGQLMITNPYSKLLTANPYLCCKLGTVPKDTLTHDIVGTTIPNPGPARKILSLSIHWTFKLQSGIQLQEVIPKAKRYVKDVSPHDPIRNVRHAIMPGIGKCEKLPLDKKQIAKVPNRPAIDITVPVTCQSNPNFQLKVAEWKSWPYTDGSCQVQDSKTVIRARVYHSMSD
eukprot:54147-Pelagomonas_calceolata.AAC.1